VKPHMNNRHRGHTVRRAIQRAPRGVTMIVVLALMSVMLLAGLAFARMAEIGVLCKPARWA
jgi:hypothetical protein